MTGIVRKARSPYKALFTARIVRGESGYFVAYCEELPGCITQGKTVEKAQSNFEEALGLYLESLAEIASRRQVPRPKREPAVKVTRFALVPV